MSEHTQLDKHLSDPSVTNKNLRTYINTYIHEYIRVTKGCVRAKCNGQTMVSEI